MYNKYIKCMERREIISEETKSPLKSNNIKSFRKIIFKKLNYGCYSF